MANYSAWKIYPSVLTPSNFHSLISSYFWYKPDVTSQQSTTRQSWPRSHLILPSSVTFGSFRIQLFEPQLSYLVNSTFLIALLGGLWQSPGSMWSLASEALSNEGVLSSPMMSLCSSLGVFVPFWNIAENSGFSYLLILQSPSSCEALTAHSSPRWLLSPWTHSSHFLYVPLKWFVL